MKTWSFFVHDGVTKWSGFRSRISVFPEPYLKNTKAANVCCKVSRQILWSSVRQAPVERLFSISGHILSQRRLGTNDRNFENVLFANVNYDIFNKELRKRKHPNSDNNNQ